MRGLVLKLAVVFVAVASTSCGAANSVYQTGSRLLESVGRTVTG